MDNNTQAFWETCWQRGKSTDYSSLLNAYYQKQDPIIDLFRSYNIRHVCDAACGFGGYTLMLSSNGFQVEGFDIAPTSVEVTKSMLHRYGIDTSKFKTASVLDTGYAEPFDAVTARSVLDHMSVSNAKLALKELIRIVKSGGIIVVSFDALDEEDLEEPHKIAGDGSILYTGGNHNGMVFHFYSDEALTAWLGTYPILLSYTNDRGERFFAIQKP